MLSCVGYELNCVLLQVFLSYLVLFVNVLIYPTVQLGRNRYM